MVVLLGTILGVMLVAQVLALVYAQSQAQKGAPDIERTHRDAAINTTVALMMVALLASPGGWYKQAPLKPLFMAISQNLKPRDKKGHGWLEPQSYKDKKEEKAAMWMYLLIHKTMLAAIVAGVAGVLGGVLSKAFEKQVQGNTAQAYVPPSGPRSPWSGRKAY